MKMLSHRKREGSNKKPIPVAFQKPGFMGRLKG